MRTQKKNGQGPYLQKSNNRWKWMASATAAGVTASQANTITINLVNNYISGAGGNHLNADLTGDGHPDLTIAGAKYSYFHPSTVPFTFYHQSAGVLLNGVYAHVYHVNYPSATMRLGSRTAYFSPFFGTRSLTGSIPIFFKDLHINGGAPTEGSLEVTVSANGTIQLDSFTYNTPGRSTSVATVPDGGPSLGLLALGAGGILALRRWRAAQGRS